MTLQNAESALPNFPMWSPSAERIEKANLTAFLRVAQERGHSTGESFPALYRWSIDRPEEFWQASGSSAASSPADRASRVVDDFRFACREHAGFPALGSISRRTCSAIATIDGPSSSGTKRDSSVR